MPRTKITDEQSRDGSFLSEREMNDFFQDVVVTGTEDDTQIIKTFREYLPGTAIISGSGSVVVVTGTSFINISGTSFSLADHEVIDSLVHGLAENNHTALIRNTQNQVTGVNTFTAVSGTLIRSTAITRNPQNQAVLVTENQHNASGTIVQTLTTTITRSQGKVVSLTTVET